MNILANVLEVKATIIKEMKDSPNGKTSETADRLSRKGLDAILRKEGAWETYMQEFAKTPEELARLIPTDGTENKEGMNDARAYLISNGPCTPDTVSNLELNVTSKLDVEVQPVDDDEPEDGEPVE